MKRNEIFDRCLAKVDPEIKAEVRANMDSMISIEERATEQKVIDIDKACKWLEGYMERLGYIDEWCRSGEDEFCKAMEG